VTEAPSSMTEPMSLPAGFRRPLIFRCILRSIVFPPEGPYYPHGGDTSIYLEIPRPPRGPSCSYSLYTSSLSLSTMSQVVDTHTCFIPALPQLPVGYKFDSNHPYQLVPFAQFVHILAPIDVCKKCYNKATTSYNLEYLNRDSARRTVQSPAAVSLGGMSRFAGVVNCQEWGKGLEAYSPPRKDRTRTKKI
jgi:hypothetical protein